MTASNIIYINGRFLTQSITGVQRFAFELVNALDKLVVEDHPSVAGMTFKCLTPKAGILHQPDWRSVQIEPVGQLAGNFWEQFDLPRVAAGNTLLSLCNSGPALYQNQFLIIHDASVYAIPEAYSFSFRVKNKLIYSTQSRLARHIITDSQFSKKELIKYLELPAERISVIYGGGHQLADTAPDETLLIQNRLLDEPYLLTVGSNSKHKNVDLVIRALAQMSENLKLVIAGGSSANVFANKQQAVENDNIIRLGYVDDGTLKALYSHAICLVFPSYYEGFGFPPLESMGCGCPVVSSNAASLPEVVGDAGLYFDPTSVSELVDKLEALMSNAKLRQQLIEAGHLQSRKFSWRDSALRFVSVIKGTADEKIGN